MEAAKPEVVLAELLHVATSDFYGCHADFYGLYDLLFIIHCYSDVQKKKNAARGHNTELQKMDFVT